MSKVNQKHFSVSCRRLLEDVTKEFNGRVDRTKFANLIRKAADLRILQDGLMVHFYLDAIEFIRNGKDAKEPWQEPLARLVELMIEARLTGDVQEINKGDAGT